MTINQEKMFDKIQKEINKVYDGVVEYAETLEDTDVITDHLYEVEKLIKELKEMI